jgi:hypothetical protein
VVERRKYWLEREKEGGREAEIMAIEAEILAM